MKQRKTRFAIARIVVEAIALLALGLSAVFGGGESAEAANTTITAGSTKTATISTSGGYYDLSFTPTTTGRYYFYSYSDDDDNYYSSDSDSGYDTYGYLLDSAGNVLAYNDDGGSGYNFGFYYDCTAGTTYTIRATMYSPNTTGSFYVSVSLYSASTSTSTDLSSGWYDCYREVGESCTLGAIAYDYNTYAYADLSSGYTFKWYKYTDDGDTKSALLGTGQTYTISSVSSADFYRYANDYPYYACEIYVGSTQVATCYWEIYEDDEDGATSISEATVILSETSYTYDGTAKKPSVVSVRLGSVSTYDSDSYGYRYGSSTALTKNRDYVVSYSNNVNAGTATVTITGIGNYKGTVIKTFTISKLAQTVTASATATSIKVGGTCDVKGVSSAGGAISYSSSNTSVATIDSSGKVTAKGIGTATITVKAAATTNYNEASTTVTITVGVGSGDKYTVSGYNVKITKAATDGSGTVSIVSPVKSASKLKKATIPATVTIGGVSFKVTSIAKNAFKGYKKLKSVTIGKNVTSIGKNAFKGCKKLAKITIKSSKLKKVGKNAIKGIKSTATIKAPKKKIKAYKKLFKSKTGFVSTMKIKK